MIDAHNPILITIVYAVLFVPIVVLGWGWFAYLRGGKAVGRPAGMVLSMVTISYMFLGLCSLFREAFLGGDYSVRLYRTAEVNLFLNIALLLSLLWVRGPSKVKAPSAAGCALVALSWYYILVVNSVV
jgi:hypothetical protein